MSVELTGISLRRRGHEMTSVSGYVALHGNGQVEFCGAAAEQADLIRDALDHADLMAPPRDLRAERAFAPSCATCPLVGRATPTCACIQADGWRVGGVTGSATVRIRPELPAAITGTVDDVARGQLRRELASFAAGRSMGAVRAA